MPYLFIATDVEAINIGIFLNAVMQLYNRWLVRPLSSHPTQNPKP